LLANGVHFRKAESVKVVVPSKRWSECGGQVGGLKIALFIETVFGKAIHEEQ
jgi:hypothetical protein